MKPLTTRLMTLRPALLSAFLLASLAAPLALFAQALDWDRETQSFEAEFEQESITATYPFANTSDQTVTIVDTKATCGCTVPSLDKKTYAPGESGELTAIFTIGSRQGKQRKLITVTTESADGEKASYELKLEVDIPVPVTFQPRVRFWKMQDAAETQEILVTFHERMPMSLDALAHKDGEESRSFDYEIETVDPGLQYRIKITPRTPHQAARDVVHLVSDDDSKGILKRYPIYAYVR